jgi:hypothetical protein
MAASNSFSGNLGAGLSTLELISAFLDQQDASSNANDALDTQIQLALQAFKDRNNLINTTIGQTNAYQSAVANGLNTLGPYGGTLFDDSDLTNEFNSRYSQYSDQANKQIDKIFSTARAGEMDKGIDDSTMDLDMRQAMAASAAQIMNQAYNQAKDDSLSYVTNLNNARYAGLDAYEKLRSGLIGENQAIYNPAISAYTYLGAGNSQLGADLLTSRGGLAQSLGEEAQNASKGFGETLDEWAKDTLPTLASWFE